MHFQEVKNGDISLSYGLAWFVFSSLSKTTSAVDVCGLDGISSIHVFMHWNNVWSDLLLAHALTTFENNKFLLTRKTEQSVVCLVALAR